MISFSNYLAVALVAAHFTCQTVDGLQVIASGFDGAQQYKYNSMSGSGAYTGTSMVQLMMENNLLDQLEI